MNFRRPSKYESFDDRNEKPPAFKRIPEKNAIPIPGTIVVTCGVCGVVYQKRLDCEFFQCENCGALVTHANGGAAPAAQHVTVVVNSQPNQQATESKKKKKKKKKKKNRKTSSSSDSDSSSSSSESDDKQKRSNKKIKELERQVKEIKNCGGFPSSNGYTSMDHGWPQPWPQVWPDPAPVSPSAQWGTPQLMDSPSWRNSSGGSSPSGGYTSQSPMNKACDGDSFGKANWGAWPPSDTCKFPSSPSNMAAIPANPWVSSQPSARARVSSQPCAQNSRRPSMNPFENGFSQTPHITVNVPPDIASLSSEQLMMLAQAKRYSEEQDRRQPFNLQILSDKRPP